MFIVYGSVEGGSRGPKGQDSLAQGLPWVLVYRLRP
jgi:hypothetical protein